MSALAIAGIVFACVFGGALLGMFLRAALPEHHLSQDSKDVVKLGTGLVATMAALVIGLLLASAKGSFDTQTNELRQAVASLVLLDRTLARIGPETRETRDLIQQIATAWLDRLWPADSSRPVSLDAVKKAPAPLERVEDNLRNLSPRDDAQRGLQARALQLCADMENTRGLFFEQFGSHAIPMPFLLLLVVWLAVIFGSFGLLAPRNPTVVAVLFLCALSASGAIFMILEMERPFQGLMKPSGAPVREAFSQLGR